MPHSIDKLEILGVISIRKSKDTARVPLDFLVTPGNGFFEDFSLNIYNHEFSVISEDVSLKKWFYLYAVPV